MELIRNIFLEARIASEEERAVVALALEGVASRKGDGVSNVGNSRIVEEERERERTWWIRLGTERVKRAFPRTRTDYWATQQGEEEGKTERRTERRGDEEARWRKRRMVERERWRQCSRSGATWHERAGG